MPKLSSWNDEQLLYFNFLFMHSVQLIFSKNWVCWFQEEFTLNLKFCGLRVHDPSLSYWGIWYDGIELLQTCSRRRLTSGIFIFQKLQNKKFLGDEIFLPEPYAWGLQRYNPLTCCLYHFELCQILWSLWVPFHALMIENHIHTTSTC